VPSAFLCPSFCLEFFARAVENVTVPIHAPAVAFRLLDFPAVLVQQPEAERHQRGHDSSGALQFHAGKSCLFQLTASGFESMVSTVPLNVMLLDLSQPSSKLIGSCSISLETLGKDILIPLRATNRGFHRGVFQLRDLMGNDTGKSKLWCGSPAWDPRCCRTSALSRALLR
jgi:hypothetical protein